MTRARLAIVALEDVPVKPATWMLFAAGVDFRLNSHDQIDDSWRVGSEGTKGRTVTRAREDVYAISLLAT